MTILVALNYLLGFWGFRILCSKALWRTDGQSHAPFGFEQKSVGQSLEL